MKYFSIEILKSKYDIKIHGLQLKTILLKSYYSFKYIYLKKQKVENQLPQPPSKEDRKKGHKLNPKKEKHKIITVEINEIAERKSTKPKAEKINTIHNPLAKLSKIKREKIHITGIQNKKWHTTSDPKDIKRK